MSIRVGINGFGRIGRNVLRAALGDPRIEFVAVNDVTDPKTLAHLLKYDSVLGTSEAAIAAAEDFLAINGRRIKVFKERDPARIDWSSLGVQVVIESTGLFTKKEDAQKHLQGTVRKTIISAPAKNEDLTLVMGVNDDKYDPSRHHVSLECFLHHQLSGTRCQSAAPAVRHHQRVDDNGSFLHQRPADSRSAAFGLAPRSSGGSFDDSHDHGSCQSGGAGSARIEREAGRNCHPGSDSERFGRRLRRDSRKIRYGRSGQLSHDRSCRRTDERNLEGFQRAIGLG